jgi:hypothetical protein
MLLLTSIHTPGRGGLRLPLSVFYVPTWVDAVLYVQLHAEPLFRQGNATGRSSRMRGGFSPDMHQISKWIIHRLRTFVYQKDSSSLTICCWLNLAMLKRAIQSFLFGGQRAIDL